MQKNSVARVFQAPTTLLPERTAASAAIFAETKLLALIIANAF